MAVQTRKERIDIRVTKEEKERIKDAARIAHQSISTFIISEIMKTIDLDLRFAKPIRLTKEEAIRFLELDKNPPEPTDSLKELLNEINKEDIVIPIKK